jgi:glycosyltransferase involved in cell wall biosynthesis
VASRREVTRGQLDRIRVLVVEPAGLLGGSERALLDLLSHVDDTRFDVMVVAPAGSPFVDELRPLGVRVAAAPLALLHLRGFPARAMALAALTTLMIRFRPHVVHVNQAGMMRLVALASRVVHAPVLCHVRLLEDARTINRRASRSARATQMVGISNAVVAELTRNEAIARQRVECVRDPLDQEDIRKAGGAASRRSIRAAVGIPDHAIVVAMVGRVCEDKRQALLIEAAELSSHSDVYYLIVGGDPPRASNRPSYRERLQQHVRTSPLSKRVLFTGMRTDVPALMMASDVVVMASEEEAFGRVLLEALTLGKPIVAPAAGGPGEIAGDDERGLTFAPGDAVDLARCIDGVIADSGAARARTERGAEWVRLVCSPDRHAREIERIYADLGALVAAR